MFFIIDNQNLNAEQSFQAVQEKDEEENFALYPNPSDGIFKLVINDSKGLPKNIVVQDVMGNTVYTVASPQTRLTSVVRPMVCT